MQNPKPRRGAETQPTIYTAHNEPYLHLYGPKIDIVKKMARLSEERLSAFRDKCRIEYEGTITMLSLKNCDHFTVHDCKEQVHSPVALCDACKGNKCGYGD